MICLFDINSFKADNIIILSEGEIAAQGKYEELKEKGIDFSEYVLKREDGKERKKSEETEEVENRNTENINERSKNKTHKKHKKEVEGTSQSAATKLITEEEQLTSYFLSFLFFF
jgi:ABC-type multidrug transport system ATPase subunit